MNKRTIATIAVITALASTAAPAWAQIGDAMRGAAQGALEGLAQTVDGPFMTNAAGGGIAEVEMGRLALQKGSSEEVRKYAQMMVDDHTKANNELKELATRKNVKLPEEPDARHRAMLDKLKGLSGTEFDKTYIEEGGVEAHTEMRTLFRSQIDSGRDADVKAFASRTLPVIEKHLQEAERLHAKMK